MEVTKITKKAKKAKRVGRGYGSGRGGHTVGRGQKGQKTRNKMNVLFEGVKVKKSYVKRLPLKRGKGKFKAKGKPLIVKLRYLDILPQGSKVNINTLSKYGIIKKDDVEKYGVKILGDGQLKKKLVVEVAISNSAAEKVKAIGGKVIAQKSKADNSKEKKDME